MNIEIPYRYLIDPDEVGEALSCFANQPILGLDTETFWDYPAGQNRLSLLQLAAQTGEVIVIDALAAGIEKARPLIENPLVMMAAHNARFDDGALRGAGFAAAGLVDTLRLSRKALKLRSFSLASVSEHLFGISLDKTHQRSDWRQRPLSRLQLNYAALDAHVALQVYLELACRLEREGRLEAELRRASIRPPEEENDFIQPARKRRPAVQLRPLTPGERECVESLKQWRRETAERERLPVYMVCQDRTLEHLAIARPTTLEELAGIFGLGASKIAKYGDQMLTHLK
jgi:ribonuclease D